ncbi:MAG: hypothetical protein ACKOJE_04560, partial [Bacteroidota bacterium]
MQGDPATKFSEPFQPSTVHINGTFNGWCGSCNTMTDANNDSIYEITLPLLAGAIEYKFTV